VTKADIMEQLKLNIGFSKQEAERLTDLFIKLMKETLEKGEKIKIAGFGKFYVREKRARLGKNPRTGDDLMITPRKVLKFQPGPLLRKALNGK